MYVHNILSHVTNVFPVSFHGQDGNSSNRILSYGLKLMAVPRLEQVY